MIWDDDNIKLLQKLWDKGLSTTEIAKKMNVSKNSIVGKVHRLCLKARPSPIKKKETETIETETTINKDIIEEITVTVEPKVAAFEATKISGDTCSTKEKNTPRPEHEKTNKKSKYVKLVELDSHTCRWPIGDPRDEDFCFCGKKVHAGQTYCDEHSQIAYVKALVKK